MRERNSSMAWAVRPFGCDRPCRGVCIRDLGYNLAKSGTTALVARLPKVTGAVPLERFAVAAELDGSTGRYRAPPEMIVCVDDRLSPNARCHALLEHERAVDHGAVAKLIVENRSA
jgi:hypothetical protein